MSDLRQRIIAWIQSQELGPGSIMPPERDLMVAVQCRSRRMIGAALASLEADGVLTRHSSRLRAVGQLPQQDLRGSLRVLVIVGMMSRMVGNEPAPTHFQIAYHATMQALAETGCTAIPVHIKREPRLAIERFRAIKPDATIVMSDIIGDALTRLVALERSRTPMVFIGDSLKESQCAQVDAVRGDQRGGAAAMVQHLATLGCRRIAQLWFPYRYPMDNVWAHERLRGYHDGCQRAGVTALAPVAVEELRHDDHSTAAIAARGSIIAGAIITTEAGGPHLDGIMALTTRYWVPAIWHAWALLGRDPRRLKIGGYDHGDTELFPGDHRRHADTDQQGSLLGRMAVDLLLDRRHGRLPPQPQQRLVPHLLTTCSG